MQALEISSMKNFMSQLLSGDTFDGFLLEEAVIRTANSYTIDGHMNADFFPPEERGAEYLPYDFCPWNHIKGLCFDLIKGKYTPLHFKFVLQLKPETMRRLLTGDNTNRDDGNRASGDFDQVKAFVLNIRYDGGRAVLTTSVSYRTFVMSREADLIWDNALCHYLNDKGIGYEKL